jgi:hypothetical protein
MKKLFIVGFVFLVIFTSLLAPKQIVSAEVNRVDITSWITAAEDPSSGDFSGNPAGITFWRDVSIDVYYTSTDPRMQGWCTLVNNRNIFPDGTAVGYGTWVSYPDDFPDGSWAGTFTASIDSENVMRVQMVGKGYGTLDGLKYSGSLEGNMMSPTYGVITELPTYLP